MASHLIISSDDEDSNKVDVVIPSNLALPVVIISLDSEEETEQGKDINNNLLEEQLMTMFPQIPVQFIREKLWETDQSQEAVERLTEIFLQHPVNFDMIEEIEEETDDWNAQKLAKLRDLFPERCPNWLQNVLEGVVSSVVVAKDTFEEKERQFNKKVEEIYSLSDLEVSRLPTLKDWKVKMQLQEELEMWTNQMTARKMLELYDDPIAAFYEKKDPQSSLYKMHSLAALREEFRYQSASMISRVFSQQGDRLLPARRELLMMGLNTRKNRRPNSEVKFPDEACVTFLKERKFCQLEEEVKVEMDRKRKVREEKMKRAAAFGLLEECVICLADSLPIRDSFL